MKSPLELRRWLSAPVDTASLAAFRILFGFLLFFGELRFLLSGWVDELYVRPTYFFRYWGLEWVTTPEPLGLYLLFAGLAVLGLMVALGFYYRIAICLFTLGFAYAEALDVTNYLNHHYLILLLAGLMCLVPANARWSVDAWRRPQLGRDTAPRLYLWLLRFQVAAVYVHAALAKAGPDWLLHGQPLQIWLSSRGDIPVLGPLFVLPMAPLAMSWLGFLYDLTIVFWLSWRPSRPFAYAVVLLFHFVTWVLFDIGLFPFVMTIATTLFFDPGWPRRLVPSRPAAPVKGGALIGRATLAGLCVFCAFQVFFPLRAHLYGGDVLWHEQGMRWGFRVMVREKNGSVTYHVRSPATGRVWQVNPHRYLQWRQVAEMSSQPDMILQLARHIGGDFARKGHGRVEVRAEAWVSLNGREPSLLIDPDVDLMAVEDSFKKAGWILEAPSEPPLNARLARASN